MHIHLTMYFFKIYIINILDWTTLKCSIAPTLVGTLDLAMMSLYDLERFHEIGIMMKEDWKKHLEQWTGPALMSVSRFFDASEPAVQKWAGNLFARRCYLSGQLWMTIRISRRRDVNESGGRDTPQHQWVNKNLFCSLLWLWLQQDSHVRCVNSKNKCRRSSSCVAPSPALHVPHALGPLLACCEPPGIYDWRHNNILPIHQYCVPCI